MYRILLTPLVVSGLVACSTRGTGYVTPGPITPTSTVQDTSVKSASLVRRLAEAADGYRDGKPHWVVIHRQGDRGHHKVLGVFMTYDEANFEAQRAGSDYAVFGPFVTLDDPPDQSTGPEDVVEVTVRQRDGKVVQIDPTKVDALFWTLAAFDKFIVPYLAKVDGAAYAAEQRELYRIGRSPFANSALVTHKAGSF